jgi:putative ABC transport system permease protein
MFHLRIAWTALVSLKQNLLRTLLATLGVIIGVGAVVAAVSILQGAQRDILDRFESLGADQLMILNGTERRGHRQTQLNSLAPDDAETLQSGDLDQVIAVAPQYQQPGQVKYFDKNTFATILGTTESYGPMNDFHPEQGRFLTREDVRGNAMVAILGFGVADELFGAVPAVGKRIKINGKTFIVIGVMEEKGALGIMEVDKQVIIPITTAMGRMFGSRFLSIIAVQCTDAHRLAGCTEQVKRALRATHRIRAGEPDDFVVYTQERFKKEFGDIARIFGIVLYSIAGISLIVGAIGIMNIMLVSVTERTREIGVRIAVGARRFDILKQFLIEAGTISFLGGALGVVAGWAMADLLGEVTEVLKTYTPPSAIISALIMAVFVGIVSGLYPAVRAARLDPIQALRYE